jgi:ketosteroid isomerase-like protein
MMAACNQAPPAADPSVITSRSDAVEQALGAEDIDALVNLYTSDTRLMPPNMAMSSGRDAVRAMFGGMIEAGVDLELTSVTASVSGDIAFHVGTYALQAGGEVVDTGKFMETWQRDDDGQWRIANDIWNSDMPAMAGGDGPMTHLMITHEVDDADLWLAAWSGDNTRHDLFKANGAAHVHTFHSADNPNLTGLVVAVTDMDALQAMLSSEEGVAAAAADGVRADTVIMLTESD